MHCFATILQKLYKFVAENSNRILCNGSFKSSFSQMKDEYVVKLGDPAVNV